jgi:CheY-like chemotaxis protein
MVRQTDLQGRSILIVEDDCVTALDLLETLSAAGALVIGPAVTIHDAVELVNSFPVPDVALLDVDIGGTAVFDVADDLASRKIPIVFATGFQRDQIPVRFRSSPHCPKPIRISTIVEALRQEIRRHADNTAGPHATAR